MRLGVHSKSSEGPVKSLKKVNDGGNTRSKWAYGLVKQHKGTNHQLGFRCREKTEQSSLHTIASTVRSALFLLCGQKRLEQK